jgi:hypothetical protein
MNTARGGVATPEPIRTTKRRRVNGEPPAPKPRVSLLTPGADSVVDQPVVTVPEQFRAARQALITDRETDLAAIARQTAQHPELLPLAPEDGPAYLIPVVPEAEQIELAARIVDGTILGDYLAAVEAFARRYVAFPSAHEPVAIALWVAHAHLVERFETSPILAVTSAEMRSGKTRVLDCLALLVPEPFRVITPSEAVVYSVLAQRPRPTMLLDEADAIFGPRSAERYEGLRAILNSGNQQDTPVMRVKLEGRRREVDAFDVFGPKAVAGIGKLPDTVADRAIPIRMKRRMIDEPIAKFRRRTATAEASGITFDWSSGTLGTLGADSRTQVPDELNDRAADSWEPLLAIADCAGGTWPDRGRRAALALSGEEDATISVGMRLLTDIRDCFADERHLSTSELLHRLHDLEDAPWEDWYGKPLTGRGLAKLLGPYRVVPLKRRLDGEQSRGYLRSEFADAWARYAPQSVPSVPSVPSDLETMARRVFADDLLDIPVSS